MKKPILITMLCAFSVMGCDQVSVDSESIDLLIKNVNIIDGSGSERYLADVRIKKKQPSER